MSQAKMRQAIQGWIHEFFKGGGVRVLEKSGPYRNFQTDKRKKTSQGGWVWEFFKGGGGFRPR